LASRRSCVRESSSLAHTPRVRRHSSPAQSCCPYAAFQGACPSLPRIGNATWRLQQSAPVAHWVARRLGGRRPSVGRSPPPADPAADPAVDPAADPAVDVRASDRKPPLLVAPRSPRRLQGAFVPARPSAPAPDPSPAPQHGQRVEAAPRPSSDSASDVVRWAAFSCVVVPVVLVVYGTSVGGAAAAALGLAAVTAACRVLLRRSERSAPRAPAAESAQPRGRRTRSAPGAHRGCRRGAGSAPGD
jgi:hypothetical protein